MDNKLKVFFVVLAVLTLLFLSGVAGNFIPKQRAAESDKDYQTGGWETTLGEWMAPLAPSLNVKSLLEINKDACESILYQYKYKVIVLSKSKDSCVINIPELEDQKYSNGKLSLIAGDAGLPGLELLYLANGKSDEPDPDPIGLQEGSVVSFVVLEKGGTLRVECNDCFESQDQTIRVKFE